MIKKLLPLLLLILIGCSERELDYGSLYERDGVHYRKDTNEIYSGPVFNIDGESEGTLKDGKFHGPYKSYYKNGQMNKDITYKDGKLDGSYKKYHDNGKLNESETQIRYFMGMRYLKRTKIQKTMVLHYDATYKDGKEDGPFKSYYKDGQLEYIATYKDGKEDGPFKSYYRDGQLKYIATYKYGKQHGPFKSYHYAITLEDGYSFRPQIYSEGNYNNGKRDGIYKKYYSNGQLEYQGEYYDGKEDGLFRSYSENGQLKEESFYSDGELQWKDGEFID